MIYVSITGFRALSIGKLPLFWWHAVRSMRQALGQPGNLFAETRAINGIQHTLSAWRSREDMLHYLTAGPHGAAMRTFPSLGTGHSFGFYAEAAPAWSEVHDLWLAEGQRRQAATAASLQALRQA